MQGWRWAAALVAALVAAACGGRSPAPAVTYNRDVAPILFAHCAACHRPGGIGPFSVLTYAEAAAHADDVAGETRERRMPPWLPAPGEFPIQGDRRLTDAQIQTLQAWVRDGVPEGEPADRPAVPTFSDDWMLGTPDALATAARPYTLAPGTEDVYRHLLLRTSLTADAWVRAVEVRTGGAPIHHAVIRLDRSLASRRRDGADGQPGFDGMALEGIEDPDGQFLGWAPGRGPIVAPEGMPWRLERGTDLVIELHMIPGGTPQSVQPVVGLFLTDAAPARTPVAVRMGTKLIDIPAGRSDYVVSDTYELPVPVQLMSLYPHAHYLGREMRVTATLPDGAVRTLLHIPRWSFHWQQDYRFVTPIPLPRGTRLTMQYTYDNSEGNPDNPHRPPVRVRGGARSTDEMAELGLQILPASAADAAVLLDAFDQRGRIANMLAAEARAREEPDVAEHRALLGATYVDVGRFAEAVPHLRAAIRLGDASSMTWNDLGLALMALDRAGEAVEALRRAAALAPGDERIQFNLGNALGRTARPEEAEAAYRRALSVNPAFPDAHVNLAVLLFSRGRRAEALDHYQRAVEIRPDSAVIHANYGGALAAVGRYVEALQHTRRALAIDPTYAPALDNLRRLERMGIRRP
ncbi:MAG: tetratricopeptide repeat protein [Vicinamibacterales bacterium]